MWFAILCSTLDMYVALSPQISLPRHVGSFCLASHPASLAHDVKGNCRARRYGQSQCRCDPVLSLINAFRLDRASRVVNHSSLVLLHPATLLSYNDPFLPFSANHSSQREINAVQHTNCFWVADPSFLVPQQVQPQPQI